MKDMRIPKHQKSEVANTPHFCLVKVFYFYVQHVDIADSSDFAMMITVTSTGDISIIETFGNDSEIGLFGRPDEQALEASGNDGKSNSRNCHSNILSSIGLNSQSPFDKFALGLQNKN